MMVSFIVPTYNSQALIEKCLKSIRGQTYNQKQIEILVCDGGSTDKTLDIARKYKCRIIPNPQRLPEIAKFLGFKAARGQYACWLDSDEELVDPTSIARRITFLAAHPEVKNIASAGALTPANYSIVSQYINRFGDPFSQFIYRSDGADLITNYRRQYRFTADKAGDYIFFLDKDSLEPLYDAGGGFFDLQFLKKTAGDFSDQTIVARVFSLITGQTHCFAVLKNDYFRHYSSQELNVLVKKIRWRIINNLFYAGKNTAGFANREQTLPWRIKLKKIIFIPYGWSIILPLIVNGWRALTQKDQTVYWLNGLLTIYVAYLILFYYFGKIFGYRPQTKGYGQ